MARPRALARRPARLVGSWRSEGRTFRQGLVALVVITFTDLTLAYRPAPEVNSHA